MDEPMNPQLQDFYARIARVESAHARGFGFESQGSIGRSHYHRPERRRVSIIKPLLVTLLCVTTLKAAIHHEIGTETYAARVAELTAGESIDRIGGYLMMADPATVWLAGKMEQYLPRF
jgi:hypothetical protein